MNNSSPKKTFRASSTIRQVAAAKANRAGVVSASASVQAAEQAVQQAQGKLLQARADLRSAQTAPQQVSMTRAKADAADAQARERKAQLDQAELNLSYTVVRSPVTGIIGKKTVEVGQNVGIGQELVEVVPLDDVWVTANFKETQLAHMRSRAAGRSEGGRLRPHLEGTCNQHGRRRRLGVQPAASGERNRKLRKSCAAGASAYRFRSQF